MPAIVFHAHSNSTFQMKYSTGFALLLIAMTLKGAKSVVQTCPSPPCDLKTCSQTSTQCDQVCSATPCATTCSSPAGCNATCPAGGCSKMSCDNVSPVKVCSTVVYDCTGIYYICCYILYFKYIIKAFLFNKQLFEILTEDERVENTFLNRFHLSPVFPLSLCSKSYQ